MPEIWRAGGSDGCLDIARAARVEADGWDGQMFMDSQSLAGDPHVLMGAWAASTARIRLSTGVTNPLTRHPAVTAAAAATLHAISGGRAVLGIGRGDSALAYLGHAPATLAAFARALADIQALLSGDETDFADHIPTASAPSLATLSLGDRPERARLAWLPSGRTKVPLDVAATGPRVIAMAATIAERVTFSVGAMPERVAWALDLARAARAAAGLPAEGVSYGAQVIVVCHPDRAAMLPLATTMVAPLARFQVMQSAPAGPLDAAAQAGLGSIRGTYDMTRHGAVLSKSRLLGTALSPDFVTRFAVVGPPDHCIDRLRELLALGLDRLVVVGPGFHPEADDDPRGLFAREVMPALH